MSRRLGAAALVAVLPFAVLPFAAWAQEPPAPRPETFNLYGMTGLIDTPTARTQPDGQLTFTSSVFSEFNRNTLHFQVLPRLEGAFRYSIIEDFFRSGEDLFDRSFDLKLRVVDESRYLPSIAVGVQDFLGTGVLSAEYVVGTKSLGYGLTATGGLGWGRLGEAGTFRNPFCQAAGRFCEREADGDAGTVDIGRYFSGEDMAVFGGLEWRPAALPGLSLMAEYSPDEYRRDRRFNSFERDIPFNFGVDYRFNEHFSLGAYAMYGSAVGLRASLGANPSRPLAPPTGADGPPPLIPRAPVLAGPPPELGEIVERITDEPAPGSDARVSDVELDAVSLGARWAEARTEETTCPVGAALDIDAQLGVVDGVTFRNAAGTPLCSVVLRPEGRAFVEAKRAQVGGRDESWAADPLQVAQSEEAARAALEAERLSVESLELSPRRARLAISNPAYSAAPTAVGRSAVALANTLPPSVEDLEITLVEGSLPVVTVSLRRARLEAIAETPDETRLSYAEARITDAEAAPPLDLQFDASYPRFSWAIGPSLPTSLFDPDNPVRLDVRLNVSAEVELTRGVFVDGAVRQRLLGNLDDITRESDSVLPRVRSDFREYLEQGDPGIERLKADVVRKIAPSTYARASAGLLESMYGGVSGEVLWKETDRNWGLGLEVNWVQQRDFDMLFAFRDYSVATGHASFYWDTNWNGMEFQLDAGRYLAEDWGGTFSLTRRFPNGWEVGGFFTLTDVPFDEFGEGSFDKGLRLRIPLRWGLPFESRSALTSTIRPLTRDGGQRLNVDRRLYEFVQDLDRDGLREDWGNFWR